MEYLGRLSHYSDAELSLQLVREGILAFQQSVSASGQKKRNISEFDFFSKKKKEGNVNLA